MNKSKSFQNFMTSIFAISLVYVIIVISVYISCFLLKNNLYNLIMKYDTPKFLPFTLSNDDIKLISNELMDYLSGKLQFLETKVNISGILTDFYNIRSKIHMSDVRNIFQTMLFSSYIAIGICVLSGFSIIRKIDYPIKNILKAYITTIITIIAIILFFTIYATINFDTFFTTFHKIIFTNDLWLLDPYEDYIICLLPEEIFMNYGLKIVITTILCLGLVALVLWLLSKIQPRQEAK